jgi:hypothetical protein
MELLDSVKTGSTVVLRAVLENICGWIKFGPEHKLALHKHLEVILSLRVHLRDSEHLEWLVAQTLQHGFPRGLNGLPLQGSSTSLSRLVVDAHSTWTTKREHITAQISLETLFEQDEWTFSNIKSIVHLLYDANARKAFGLWLSSGGILKHPLARQVPVMWTYLDILHITGDSAPDLGAEAWKQIVSQYTSALTDTAAERDVRFLCSAFLSLMSRIHPPSSSMGSVYAAVEKKVKKSTRYFTMELLDFAITASQDMGDAAVSMAEAIAYQGMQWIVELSELDDPDARMLRKLGKCLCLLSWAWSDFP